MVQGTGSRASKLATLMAMAKDLEATSPEAMRLLVELAELMARQSKLRNTQK